MEQDPRDPFRRGELPPPLPAWANVTFRITVVAAFLAFLNWL